MNDAEYEPVDDIEWCVKLFFIGQAIQAIGFLYWSFTEYYVFRGGVYRNIIVP